MTQNTGKSYALVRAVLAISRGELRSRTSTFYYKLLLLLLSSLLSQASKFQYFPRLLFFLLVFPTLLFLCLLPVGSANQRTRLQANQRARLPINVPGCTWCNFIHPAWGAKLPLLTLTIHTLLHTCTPTIEYIKDLSKYCGV